MKTNFVKTLTPCVVNEVTCWHLAHGFLWDVVEVSTGRKLGVFYVTLLCGDGCIIHFYALPGIDITPATTLYTFRKAINMTARYGNVLYATVPEDHIKLLRVLCRLGFAPVPQGGFVRDGVQIVLLKYLPAVKAIL